MSSSNGCESSIPLSELIDRAIDEALDEVAFTIPRDPSPCDELLSMGELVDRLTIVNLKLFSLKNEVMRRQDDNDFLADAAIRDVRLVEERARLKKCIDHKLTHVIRKLVGGDQGGGFNPEVKSYA